MSLGTRAFIRTAVLTAASLGVVLGLAGCSSTPGKGHQKAVNAANARWRDTRSELVLQMAQRHFDAGDLEQAEKSLVEGLSVDPANPHLHLLAGRVALERGQLERAFGRFQSAQEFAPELAAPCYFQGIVLQRWQKYEQAYDVYHQAYEKEADNIAYLMAMGEMLVAQDRMDQALTLLESKVDYFAQNAGIRMAVGQLYTLAGNHAKALLYVKEAAALQPDNLALQEELAYARLRAGEIGAAVAHFERLVQTPELAQRDDLKRTLAACYQKAGRLEQARDLYLRLSRENPRDHETWIRLGEIAWREQDLSGALLAAGRVMAMAPERPEGYLLAGMVWQRRGDLDKALRHFDQAAEAAPQQVEALILRGIALREAGRSQAAAATFAQAARRRPDDPRLHQLLASVDGTGGER